ncbi:disulfide bond formation protein DsbA [Stutzerimonas frequens]|uniref:DsbA family protein n=2 Tax=Stutzerimonas frequens TaxID=2968969 RepID=A0ABX6Y0I4_9GAMM|nr:DsbA family protein [Stutzerimonas frequens]PNF49418.1 disulfide bond formation protein DsbA [Stutzerimonas frequens]QPT19840.1 DsbA family protein [Stutzerimonas frequens]
MCSWCWGFAPVLLGLAEQAAEYGVPLVLKVGGLRREQIAMDEAGRSRTLSYWQAVHNATGQPFDFEGGLPAGLIYNTEPACRALVAARGLDESRVWPLSLLIQQAFYQQGRDVTQAALLVELAEAAGLSRERFAESYDDPATKAETSADFSWVENLGIAGFPTLLAEHEGQLALLTNGYQPLTALAPFLGRWLEHNAHA